MVFDKINGCLVVAASAVLHYREIAEAITTNNDYPSNSTKTISRYYEYGVEVSFSAVTDSPLR